MGIYVTLEIIPYAINLEQWSEVYLESLELLRAYSGELMGRRQENLGFAERMVYSRNLEHDIYDPKKRHWYVVGDFATKMRAESFVFYYDLNRYRRHSDVSEPPVDIFLALAKDRRMTVSVFNDKTQGYSYHMPMLAVATLVESRFPNFALAGGDIDIWQAKRVIQWVNNVLKKKIDLPIRVQGKRLYKRIKKYCGELEAIDIFTEFFRGPSKELYRVLQQECGRTNFVKWITKELKSYRLPTQLGVLSIFINWLNVTHDIKELCEIACVNQEGPKYDPVDFASTICSTWVSIENKYYDFFKLFSHQEGMPERLYEQIGHIFFDITAKGREMEYYISEEELVEVFKGYFPERIDEIKDAVHTKLESIKKELSCTKEIFSSLKLLDEKDIKEDDFRDSFLFFEEFSKLNDHDQKLLQVFAYGIREFRNKNWEDIAKLLNANIEEIRERIVKLTIRRRIILTEDAWGWIDKEDNMEMLGLIITFLVIANDDQEFSDLRRATLENRLLLQQILRLMNDEKAMFEAKKFQEKKVSAVPSP